VEREHETFIPEEKGPREKLMSPQAVTCSSLSALQLNNLISNDASLKTYFATKAGNFKAGKLAMYVNEWKQLTSDREIINTVTFQHTMFTTSPLQSHNVKSTGVSPQEQAIIEITE